MEGGSLKEIVRDKENGSYKSRGNWEDRSELRWTG